MRLASLSILLLMSNLLVTAAHATPVITGSYTGLSTEDVVQRSAPGLVTLTNVPVTGTFGFDLTGCAVQVDPMPNAGSCFDTLVAFITYNSPTFPSFTYNFGVPEGLGLITVTNLQASQTVTFDAGYTNPYGSAILTLAGAPGAFIDGTDYQSLHPGTVNLAGSSLLVYGGRDFNAGVTLTSITINNVPEPTTATLLATLIVLGVTLHLASQRRS